VTSAPHNALRASTAQEGIWVTEQAGIAAGAYTMPLVVWLYGDLDVRALEQACSDLIRRHALLRCTAHDYDGRLILVDTTAPSLRLVTSQAPKSRRTPSAVVAEHVALEIDRGFDLASGPLFRMSLISLRPQLHVFIAIAHHIIFDGISKDLLLSDLAESYNARKNSSQPHLDPLTESVAETLDKQRRMVEEARPDAARYWAHRWRPTSTPILPGLRRLPSLGESGEAYTSEMASEVVGALAFAVEKLHRTRFELLLAGVHVLLFRYGNRDSSVAVDVSTRVTPLRHIGLFVNELPVFVDLQPDATFSEVALRVATELRDIKSFRAVPLARAGVDLPIVTAVAPVSLSYRARAALPHFDGLSIKVEWIIFNGTARNALHLQVVDSHLADDRPKCTPKERPIELSVQYCPRVMGGSDVKRIVSHLETLLRTACARPDLRIKDLPLMMEEERGFVVGHSSGPQRSYDLSQTVVSLFRRTAVQRNHSTAVTFGEARLSYLMLDALSDRVAHGLLAAGVGAGTIVALKLKRSLLLPVAMLGVLKSGGAYLPIDAACPPERAQYMLSDAQAALLVTDDERQMSPFPPDQSVCKLDIRQLASGHEDERRPASPRSVPSLAGPTPDDLAYVIFTSGSTGRPKGVEIVHRSLMNVMYAFGELVGDGRNEWLAHTSLSFDIAAIELLYPLLVGGRVVLAGDAETRDGPALLSLIRREGVSHVQATPSGWTSLMAAGSNLPGVVAISTGEPLPLSLAHDIRARTQRLINAYGPTEGTIWCTGCDIGSDAEEVSIGRPLPNTTAYVVDADLQLLPIGIPGELCIGGECVASGYRNHPELTEERFRPDPFLKNPSALERSIRRLYMTGDVARLRDDGGLVLMGRRDNQVKLRGHRIELGEVEAALIAQVGVLQAAVTLQGGSIDGRLIAYVSPKRGATCEASDLRAQLGRVLPSYMVPSTYIILDHLPVTPNGKLDRSRLPAADVAPPLQVRDRGQADELTEDVRQIVCGVLSRDWVGEDDDLLDLGAHSLNMLSIIGHIRTRHEVEIPIGMLFDAPTLFAIVNAIKSVTAPEAP
jgi:amino acid adenylation domain-containing protein